MIIINKMNFPIYGIIILISLIIGITFNYIYLKNNKIQNQKNIMFVSLLFIYSLFGGIVINSIINFNLETINIGLSSYGGAIGIIICAMIFEKMDNSNGIYIKSAILSLPLIYSISKLACFFSGCCYGIPYNGIFSIIYTEGLNMLLFPIQLVETIVFLIIFIICYTNDKNKYIIPITIFLSALSKFLLDFYRYSHLNEVLSVNQIISIIFIAISIILFIKHKIHKSTDQKF